MPSHTTEFIGRFRCRWLQPFKAPAKTTAIVLAGGPGLSPDYMLPWARHFARQRSLNLALIEYPVISDGETLTTAQKYELFKDALLAIFKRIAGDSPPILIGHSFSCRVLLDLQASRELEASALILLNCPATFISSASFRRAAKKLRLPASIESEKSFRSYWKRILPLYFHVPMKKSWERALARRTSWMRCSWLTDIVRDEVSAPSRDRDIPVLFIHGANDLRFPKANRNILRGAFRESTHVSLGMCGHFPMLESPRNLFQEAVFFLDKIKPRVRQS